MGNERLMEAVMRASIQRHCVAMNGDGVMDECNRRMQSGNCFFCGKMLFKVDGHPVRGLLGDGLLGVNRWRVRCRGEGETTKPMPAIPYVRAYPAAICPAPSSPSQRAPRYGSHVLTSVITARFPTSFDTNTIPVDRVLYPCTKLVRW